MDEELCKKRVLKRHGEDNEWDKIVANILLEVYLQCEFAGKEEENTFTIEVTEEMTPEVVANEILILLEGTDTWEQYIYLWNFIKKFKFQNEKIKLASKLGNHFNSWYNECCIFLSYQYIIGSVAIFCGFIE